MYKLAKSLLVLAVILMLVALFSKPNSAVEVTAASDYILESSIQFAAISLFMLAIPSKEKKVQ